MMFGHVWTTFTTFCVILESTCWPPVSVARKDPTSWLRIFHLHRSCPCPWHIGKALVHQELSDMFARSLVAERGWTQSASGNPLKSTSGYTKIYEVPINFKWRQPVSGWLGILCWSLPRCHMPSRENRRRVWSLSEFRCSVHGRRVRLYYQKKSAVWQELCQLSSGMLSQRYVQRKAHKRFQHLQWAVS